jgi:hypothetical protein
MKYPIERGEKLIGQIGNISKYIDGVPLIKSTTQHSGQSYEA